MFTNAGLPSLAVTFSVISMPSTSLPPQVLFGSVISRTRLGFCCGERLHLGLVVRERAVARAAAGQVARRRRREAGVGGAVARALGDEVADQHAPGEARSRAASRGPARRAGRRRARRARRARSCRARARPAGPCRRASGVSHAHELRRVRARLRGVAGHRRVRDGRRDRRRCPERRQACRVSVPGAEHPAAWRPPGRPARRRRRPRARSASNSATSQSPSPPRAGPPPDPRPAPARPACCTPGAPGRSA